MNTVAAQRSAQLAYDNASPPEDDALAESLLHDFRNDPAKIAEADASWSGGLDCDQYSEIETALADLHGIDADKLIGSDALAAVLRLAKVCHEAREDVLSEMADEEAAKQRRDAEDMRADYAAMSRAYA